MEETKQEHNQAQRPRFPKWIRAVALLLVVVFVPEQAAWAMGYDPSVIWAPKYYLGTGQAGYMANFVAENVRRSLNHLAYRPLQSVEIAPNLVIDTKPIKIRVSSDEKIETKPPLSRLDYYFAKFPTFIKVGIGVLLQTVINILEFFDALGRPKQKKDKTSFSREAEVLQKQSHELCKLFFLCPYVGPLKHRLRRLCYC